MDKPEKVLSNVFGRLEGFRVALTPEEVSRDAGDVIAALCDLDDFGNTIKTFEQIVQSFTHRLTILMRVCAKGRNIYRRVGGQDEFWAYVQAEWSSCRLLTTAQIKDLVQIVVKGRRDFLGDYTVTKLVEMTDIFINAGIDMTASRVSAKPTLSLAAPTNEDAGPLAVTDLNGVIWPPVTFAAHDVAMLGLRIVRDQLFGINSSSPEAELCWELLNPEAISTMSLWLSPNKKSRPRDIRRFLAYHALMYTEPDGRRDKDSNHDDKLKGTTLYLSPVAFTTHAERQTWYNTTGRKSRLYATVGEFLTYAEQVLFSRRGRCGSPPAKHAIALLTPWMLDKNKILHLHAARQAETAGDNNPGVVTTYISDTWLKHCPRTGLVLVLSKTRQRGLGKRQVRLLLFQPGSPRYEHALEPGWPGWPAEGEGDRFQKLEDWIEKEVYDAVEHVFDVKDGWNGRNVIHRYEGDGENNKPDAVEIACQFVREVMESPGQCLPETKTSLVTRGFAKPERYWDDHEKDS